MDRDSFPTLIEGDTGWPVMRIPFVSGGPLEIEYYDDHETGLPTVHLRSGDRSVQVLINGQRLT